MVQHEALHQLCVSITSVLHNHDFDHKQIKRLTRTPDGEHSINNNIGQVVCYGALDLGPEWSARHTGEELLVQSIFLYLVSLKKLEHLLPGQVKAFCEHSWMQIIRQETSGLFQDFTNEKDIWSSAISSYVILSCGCAGNKCGSRVLDLLYGLPINKNWFINLNAMKKRRYM